MITNPPKSVRMQEFFKRLQASGGASSRDEAIALLKQQMNEVEAELTSYAAADYSNRMHVWGIDANNSYEWQDLQQDPCYWDDALRGVHRTYIYNSGRIVIHRLVNRQIQMPPLLDLAGK